jgi:cytochrome c553
MTADFLPRPGAQFLWLYQSLKYVPGGLGSIMGLVLPGIALLALLLLRRLRATRLIGGAILGGGALLIVGMTSAAYISDYKNTGVREQATAFTPTVIDLTPPLITQGAPVLYVKWCANCHGPSGEGGQQGRVRFPALTGVSAKPRRTADDIVGLLKNPEAYGLMPPMRSFSDKLTEPQMKEIAQWVHRLR